MKCEPTEKVYELLFVSGAFASAYTVVVMSIERFLALTFPVKYKQKASIKVSGRFVCPSRNCRGWVYAAGLHAG